MASFWAREINTARAEILTEICHYRATRVLSGARKYRESRDPEAKRLGSSDIVAHGPGSLIVPLTVGPLPSPLPGLGGRGAEQRAPWFYKPYALLMLCYNMTSHT